MAILDQACSLTPHLTSTGRAALLAAVSLILIGAVATNWPILLLGEVVAVLLAALYLSRTSHLLAIEEGFVGVGVRDAAVGETRGGVAGQPSPVEVEVINLSGLPFHRLVLTPECEQGLEFDPPEIELAGVQPRTKATLTMNVQSAAAGRYVLHGFRLRSEGIAGLVAASDYVPTPLPLKFLPAVVAGRSALPSTTRDAIEVQVMGQHRRRHRGFGSDFRELRDHVVGDPFRNISWKATARTGKLMVREFEDEVVANAYVLLDISSTMRGGMPPRTKLAHTIELITELASLMARNQDQLGLITFDEVVYGHIRSGNARRQFKEMVDHLVGLTSIADPDLTELTDDEVLAQLVRYLMVQERLDFRRQSHHGAEYFGEEQYDVELLEYWLGRELPREQERIGDRCLTAGVVRSGDLSSIRRFCQLRGVNVPFRLEARFGAKEMGVVRALERFLEESKESNLLLLITDLCGLVQTSEIQSALRVVLSRKHRVVVAMPYTPEYLEEAPQLTSESGYDRAKALFEVFCLAERRERARIKRAITTLGIPVVPIGPGATLSPLLRVAASGARGQKRRGRARARG